MNKIFYFSKPNFNILPILSFYASHGKGFIISVKIHIIHTSVYQISIHLKPHSWELSSYLPKNVSFYFFKSACQARAGKKAWQYTIFICFQWFSLCHLLWSLDNSDQMKCNNQNQQVSPLPWQTLTRKGC